MKTVAVFAVKGGVGKTATAVNLAYAAATAGGRRTLLWDLDAQGAATFLLKLSPKLSARKAIAGAADVGAFIQASAYPGLDVLPADASLGRLDRDFARDDKTKQLRKLLKGLETEYDRVILDCPPGLTELAERVFRAADLLVVPMLPAPLSVRASAQLFAHLKAEHAGKPPVLPVFTMVDRRKTLHRDTAAAAPDQAVIPYAVAIEAMSVRQEPVAATQPNGAAARAFATLWAEAERALA